jgi:3-phosphoshikimate 1-carboxyvinyltransferase
MPVPLIYFLLDIAAITGVAIALRGCGSESVQGIAAFAIVMAQLGATMTWAPNSITIT